MKKLILICLALTFIQSAQANEAEQEEKLSSFVLQCIKNGNPMSDEEPEDLVRECVNAARTIFCEGEESNVALRGFRYRCDNESEKWKGRGQK